MDLHRRDGQVGQLRDGTRGGVLELSLRLRREGGLGWGVCHDGSRSGRLDHCCHLLGRPKW